MANGVFMSRKALALVLLALVAVSTVSKVVVDAAPAAGSTDGHTDDYDYEYTGELGDYDDYEEEHSELRR